MAVRMDQWKAIQPKKEGAWELYDLSKDVSETTDLAAQYPDRLARMKELRDRVA